MRLPITIPAQFSVESLRLGDWSVEPGDAVLPGECLAELISPGLVLELVSPAGGRILELNRQPDQPVSPCETVGWLDAEETPCDAS